MTERPVSRDRAVSLAAWLLVAASILVFALATTSLRRYFTWDEAVYYSQSGPFGVGTNGPRRYLPSRELGTAWLIEPFRALGLDLTAVRAAWLVLAIVLTVVVFAQLGRLGPRFGGEVTAFLFGTYWITGA